MSDEPQAKKRIMDEELGARVDMTRHPHQSQEDLTVNTVDGEWPFPWQNELASLKADRDRLSRDDVEPSRGSEVKKNGTSPPCEQLTSSSREDVDAANEAEREEFPSLSASMMGRDSRRSYRSSYRRSSGSRNSKGSGRRQQSSHTPNTFNNRLRGRRRNNEEWNGYQYVPPSGMSGEDEEVKPDLNVLLNPREPDWSNPRFSTYNLAELKSARKTLVGLNDPSLSFVDTHCHLDFLLNKLDWSVFSGSLLGQAYEKFKAEREEEFGTLHEACITCFTHPQLFTNERQWASVLTLDGVFVTFGCHPHWVADFADECRDAMIKALKHPRVIAAGEFGLDYCVRKTGNNPDKPLQQAVFRDQLQIALDANKPIVIHCREAHEDCLRIMIEMVPEYWKIHRHCVTNSMEEMQEWMDAFPNCYFGFTNFITAPKSRPAHDSVRNIPLERIILETDSPYHFPHVLNNPKPALSHPGMVLHVAAQIACLKGVTLEKVVRTCRQNTRDLYGI